MLRNLKITIEINGAGEAVYRIFEAAMGHLEIGSPVLVRVPPLADVTPQRLGAELTDILKYDLPPLGQRTPVPWPTFNHTREDSWQAPCDECRALMPAAGFKVPE